MLCFFHLITINLLTYVIGGPSIACRSGENVLCNVWLSIGDFACLETASYNGLQMAWVSTTVDAVVVVEAVGPGLVVTLETSPPDGVGGAGGVGTDGCQNEYMARSKYL